MTARPRKSWRILPAIDDMTAPALLEVSELSVVAKNDQSETPLLKRISLSLERHEVLAVIGESGAGKTMMSMALLGMLPSGTYCSAGKMHFDGGVLDPANAASLAALRGKEIAMIFQNAHSAFNPVFSVGRQIRDVVRRHLQYNKKAATRHVLQLLADVALDNPEAVFNAYPHQLSGGMAQRCMIAMALSCRPSLVIADEPTSALDATIQVRILELLSRMQKERGFGLLLISHNLQMVRQVADRLVVLYRGEVVETGPVDMIFDKPKHAYTRRLIEDDLWSDLPVTLLADAARQTEGGEQWQSVIPS